MMHKFMPNGQTEQASVSPHITQKSKYILIFVTLMVLLISGLYLQYEWRKYQEIASSEAIQLAQALETLLHPQHIEELSGSAKDIENPEYSMTKTSLMRLVDIANPIRFAYLMGERNGNLVFLMDSESPESPDYSPPGQFYEEGDDWVWRPFKTGKTIITPPRSDRWGTWINAFVPIKNPKSGETIAILGIDYSASEWYAALWKQMIPDIMVVFVILMLYFSLSYIRLQHARLNSLNRKSAFDEALYGSVFDQAPIGIAIVNDKNFIYQSDFGHASINPMFEKILGRKSSDLSNMKWTEITHTEDLAADLENFDQFKKGNINGYTMEKRFVKPDGSVIWTNMSISPLLGIYDDHSMHLCLVEDISARKQTEIALKERERRETVLLSHLPGLAYRRKYDRDGTMLIVSDGCYNLTGYMPECFISNRDMRFNDIISPEYRELLWSEWESTTPARLPYQCEYAITTATGNRKWVLEMGQGIYDERGEAEALEGIILDISDRKEMENNLRYLNEHDGWTGLYNRDYLEFLLEKDTKKKDGLKRAVISINLSTVQLLAANYGFHYTQNLIKKAAETLNQYCTDKRILFQTYESRFVFYLIGYKDKNELLDFSEVIADSMESLFLTDRIGGGIGILEIKQNQDEVDMDSLLRRLLIASERSINIFDRDFRVCFYDEALEDLVNREGDIRQALSSIAEDKTGEELFLQYQPIFDLKTDSVVSFEALARLRTQKLGLVSPSEFIPIAEKTKLIIPIGDKIMVHAFHFLNKLKENGYETMAVSINVSPIQLLRPDFASRLFALISELHVNPQNIGIEITESVFTSDYENINHIIEKLRDAGLHIAIDDFGTGYSSLAREKELSVNCLKIDKYFIDKLLDTDLNKALTSDIISMAHKIGHCTIAEGVEHESQLQYLKEHDCDRIQGYLISKPLDEEDALKFLKKQENNGDCHSNDSQR